MEAKKIDKLKFFLKTFIPFSLIGLIAFSIMGKVQLNTTVNKIKMEENVNLEISKEVIMEDMLEVKTDLLYLSQTTYLNNYINKKSYSLGEWSKELYIYSKNKKMYDQIRYIDEKGFELVRINSNKIDPNTPLIIKKSELQNKKDRYYFKNSIDLKLNQIYVSPLDLNKENKEIEIPLKPMIRFVTPVFNENKEVKGLVVLNYLGEKLLDKISTIYIKKPYSIPFLLNKESYYLLGEKGKEWGFMYDKKDINFKNEFPDIWEEIEKNESGQYMNGSQLFTYTKIRPLETIDTTLEAKKGYYWILVSYVPKKHIDAIKDEKILTFLFSGMIILTILTLISLVSADRKCSELEKINIIEKKNLELKIKNDELFHLSSRDGLTGIYNRRYIMKLFEKEFKLYKSDKKITCVLFDVDRFKTINDTYGHLIGDIVLKKITKIVIENISFDDLFGRYGGDEFFLIFLGKEDYEIDEILEKIRSDIFNLILKIDEKKIRVTISLGVARSTNQMKESEDMIVGADLALYRAKENGRNRIERYN
ncbi:GGDEF domain-containing protein [Fusobacteria bacterium ZRK30]|nr:GGDEF domain-containing protein [Fusobacteria bacterium ZRK30]